MANETLNYIDIVETSPDVPMTVNEVFLTFTIVEGINDIIYTSNDKRIMTSGNKTILGKIIKRI